MTASLVFDTVVIEVASMKASLVFDTVATVVASEVARNDRVAWPLSLE